jgi:hypothetical protein
MTKTAMKLGLAMAISGAGLVLACSAPPPERSSAPVERAPREPQRVFVDAEACDTSGKPPTRHPECAACLAKSCAAVVQACFGDPSCACQAVDACIQTKCIRSDGPPDPSCIQACIAPAPDAADRDKAFVDCLRANCTTEAGTGACDMPDGAS